MKANQIKHLYRNPIYLAREYRGIIDNGQVINQSELARKLGVSRIRVHQVLNLLKLNLLIIEELEKFGDSLESKIITERMLQSYIKKTTQNKKIFLIS